MKFLFLILFLILHSEEKVELEKELQSVQENIVKTEQEKKLLKKEESSILEKLRAVSKSIERKEKNIKKLQQEEKEIEQRISILTQGSDKANLNLKSEKNSMEQRLVLLYKEVITSSEVFEPDLVNIRYIDYILDANQRKVKQIETLRQSLDFKRTNLEIELNKLHSVRKKQEDEKHALKSEKRAKDKLLKKIKEEKELKARVLNELQESRNRLEGLIAGLKKYPGAGQFGNIVWPIKGRIILSYGTVQGPEYGTKLISNGIDIESPPGMPVKACGDGEVVYADDFLGYGKIVLIDHKNGFHSLYAHLSRILVLKGEEVEIGTIIGKVGDTGSIRGSLLHFELRKNGKAVNPLNYLK